MQLFRVGTEATAGFRFRQLRRQFRSQRPHRVLALLTRTNITCCCAAWDLPIHLVVSERNDPSLQLLPEVWQRLRPLAYRRADVVTANTAGVLTALESMGAWERLALLPNPLPGVPAPARRQWDGQRHRLHHRGQVGAAEGAGCVDCGLAQVERSGNGLARHLGG